MRGLFITFEGTEGSGKSTLIKNLKAKLGKRAVSTREPGGSPVSEEIRRLLLDTEMSNWTEAFLYEAARAEHVEKTILPALKKNKIVLCDRYGDSTLAYQGTARGLPRASLKKLNQIATQNLVPDLSVFLDLPVEIGLKRAKDPNKFERAGVAFQKKVRRGFLQCVREEPKRWLHVRVDKLNAHQTAETVLKHLEKRFSL